MHHPTDRITHTTDFVTPVVGLWLEREIVQWIQDGMEGKNTCIHMYNIFIYRHTVIAGHVLFKDAHTTFYLQLYGVGHMVKDHSDSERGNQLPPLGHDIGFFFSQTFELIDHCRHTYIQFSYWSVFSRSSDRSFMVDPLSYISFQSVLYDWCNKGRGM